MRQHVNFHVALMGVAVSLMACATGLGQNLIQNPGFESPPDTANNVDNTVDNWTLLLDTSRATFYNNTPSGSWSLWLKTFEAAGGGATQTVPVTAGKGYDLTAQLLFEPSFANIPNIDTFLSLQFQDSSGTDIGPAVVNHIATSAVNANKTWSPYSVLAVAPAGATQVVAEIGWANGSTVPGQQSAFADDVTLVQAAVPEPSSFCLLSVAGAALLLRRRHANAA